MEMAWPTRQATRPGRYQLRGQHRRSGTGTILMRGVFATHGPPAAPVCCRRPVRRIRLPIGARKRPSSSPTAPWGPIRARSSSMSSGQDDAETGRAHPVVERRYVSSRRPARRPARDQGTHRDRALPPNQKVAANEKVVVSGLQRIRQGSEVTPRLVAMPAFSRQQDNSGDEDNDSSHHLTLTHPRSSLRTLAL